MVSLIHIQRSGLSFLCLLFVYNTNSCPHHAPSKGPIFNYARALTWWKVAITVEDAFRATLRSTADQQNNLPASQIAEDAQSQQNSTLIQGATRRDASSGHSSQARAPPRNITSTSRYCGLHQPKAAYPKWSELDPGVWKRLFVACLAALFLQWVS